MGSGILQVFMGVLVFSTYAQASNLSSFAEVREVLVSPSAPAINTEVAKELKVYQEKLPQYQMNMDSIFKYGSAALENAAKRTVTDKSDYLDRLPKLLHPNGVCVMGEWKIKADSPYTGAFAANTNHLFIGRISVAMQETTAGNNRGFGFAGKVFPTMDANQPVATENFFSVDVLMGTKVQRFLDTATTNEPETGFDLWLVRLGLKIASALGKADENPGFRPLYNLGQMGLQSRADAKYPHWIRLSADSSMKRNNQADFRNEVLQAVHDNTELVFHIDVSDTTKDRNSKKGWSRIGEIRVSEATVSYGCDRRLHFAHPKLKQ